MKPASHGEWLLLAAAVTGFIHALPSLYWAFGGTAGISSLGSWAPQWRSDSPMLVGFVLVGIFW